MKIDYLKRNYLNGKSRFAPVLLLVVSACFAILILAKVASLSAASARAEELVREAIANGKTDVKNLEEQTAKSKALANELKRNNLFAPAPAKQHPVKGVSGILGDEALINGKWYKVGDAIADAKVVSIEPTRVKIEWEGTPKTFAPMSESSSEEQGGPRRSRPDMRGTPRRQRTGTAGPPAVVVRSGMGGRGHKVGFTKLTKGEKAERKQKPLIGKGELKKLLKSAPVKKPASPKKDVAQAKKASGGTKTKKQTAEKKTKKAT